MVRDGHETASVVGDEVSLEQTIASLDTLDADGLRLTWRRLFQAEPPLLRASSLLRMELAWALQARVFGDLDARTRQRLQVLARPVVTGGSPRRMAPLSPGMVLVREWRGQEHRVEVLTDGFSFEGERYRSLSAVARRIAGARWSGPRFFGLLSHDTPKQAEARR